MTHVDSIALTSSRLLLNTWKPEVSKSRNCFFCRDSGSKGINTVSKEAEAGLCYCFLGGQRWATKLQGAKAERFQSSEREETHPGLS